jgi:hypothetical protein
VSQAKFIRRILELLDRSDIPHMIVGSLASAFHGVPRATQDVDIVVDPTETSLAAFLERLPVESYYVDPETARDALERRTQFNVVDLASGWKADLVIRKHRAFSVEELRRRVRAEIEGVAVAVASPEDTVVAKLEWSALAESERQLRDVCGIIATQGATLDREYIERWVRALGLEAQWRRALQLAEDSG